MPIRLKKSAMWWTIAALAAGLSIPAEAQSIVAPAASPPSSWTFEQGSAYGYGENGDMTVHKLGTNNAKFLFKGAKKVPRNTLFFVGENGQLYMRTGPYLENGKFNFGPG